MLGITLFQGGEFLMIGDHIEIRAVKACGGGARLALWVPAGLEVVRGAVYIRRVIERTGTVEESIRRQLPSARDGWKPLPRNANTGEVNDVALWSKEAEVERDGVTC